MGTIIVNEYLRVADIPVSKVVFDGYVADPKSWNDKLAGKGKQVIKNQSITEWEKIYKMSKTNNRSLSRLYKELL